jgi:predicted dehydrogenase
LGKSQNQPTFITLTKTTAMQRRSFLKNVGMSSAAFLFLPDGQIVELDGDNTKKVRIAVIGTGLRGQDHLDLLLRRSDVEVVAICDINERMINDAKALFKEQNKPMPEIFLGDKHYYKKLLEKHRNIDAVLIATPWEWHHPMVLDSIAVGIQYIATEVVLGITLQDHWDVVQAAVKSNAHVMMLENVCYRRDVMAVLNMVRQGLFGELIHLQGGYQHDLREVKFNDGVNPYGHGVEFGEKGFSEAQWRTAHSLHRNGDLYPTHGIGPIANYININRGNRFTALCSFSSKARGLHNHIVKKGGAAHPNANLAFKLGDVVTTNIACANGETILLQHDTNLPRPYSLGFRVQGTNGIWMDVNKSIHIEEKSKAHHWDEAKTWLDQYDHPLWKRWSNATAGAGHGGMDFFVIHAFIESIKRQQPTPLNVFDAAAWSAITPLSEQSIALGNETVEFPDFTSGQWMHQQPLFALNDEY